MKLEKLVINAESLQELGSIPLSDQQKAWDLSISLDAAAAHVTKFNEKRDALVKRIGEPVPDQPDQFQVPTDKFDEFTKELEKLGSVDVKVSFPKIKLELLKDIHVSPANISAWRELGILIKK